jgi:hypothetical protein
MSNEKEVEEFTADLRADDLKGAAPAKHTIAKPPLDVADPSKPLTAADVLKLSQQIEANVRKQIAEAKFDAGMSGQILPKRVTPISDFSNVTLDQVYDIDFPIEAKPFMSADGLVVKLKDTNYEARWVNKNPQRIGEMLGKGFTYICPSDLHSEGSQKAIEPSLDAEGHYTINDVVAMKIDKATYYRALRFAHERAVGTTNNVKLHERAAKAANTYMQHSDARNDFQSASNERKMAFYSPDVTI